MRQHERGPASTECRGASGGIIAGAVDPSLTIGIADRNKAGARLADDPAELFDALPVIDHRMIAWLISQGVPPVAGIAGQSGVLKRVNGQIGPDGWFDTNDAGSGHVAVLVCAFPDDLLDVSVWQPRSTRLGSYMGRAFALGEDQIDNPATYFGDGGLLVHRTPLDWLRAGRRGIVIMRPEQAHIRLRHVPRLVAADVAHGQQLRRLLTPRLPEIFVCKRERIAA